MPSSPLRYAGLGFELVVPVVLLLLLGRWADGRLGTAPWLLVTGAVVGAVVGFVTFVRSVLPPKGGPGGRG